MRINLSDDDVMEVQMAPLIDCVFLLLIFFLVATTLKKFDRELPLELPISAAAVKVPRADDMINISIDPQGEFYIAGAPASIEMLREELQIAARTNLEQKIRIEGDRAAPFESLVHVLDLCNFEGLTNVRIRARDE